jgi:hypothetical protein
MICRFMSFTPNPFTVLIYFQRKNELFQTKGFESPIWRKAITVHFNLKWKLGIPPGKCACLRPPIVSWQPIVTFERVTRTVSNAIYYRVLRSAFTCITGKRRISRRYGKLPAHSSAEGHLIIPFHFLRQWTPLILITWRCCLIDKSNREARTELFSVACCCRAEMCL